MKITKNDVFFVLSLLCALWFTVIGMVWVYYVAVWMAYPIGGLSFLFMKMMKEESIRTKIVKYILIFGLFLSFSVLVYLLIFD